MQQLTADGDFESALTLRCEFGMGSLGSSTTVLDKLKGKVSVKSVEGKQSYGKLQVCSTAAADSGPHGSLNSTLLDGLGGSKMGANSQ